jgi:hypothetical protein
VDQAEWLAFDDPEPMLEFLRGRASPRKLRLFAAACCRRVSPLMLANDLSHLADKVEVVERYADGAAGADELRTAHYALRRAAEAQPTHLRSALVSAIVSATAEAYLRGHAVRVARLCCRGAGWSAAPSRFSPASVLASVAERSAQARLLRDLFGSPFHPPREVDPDVLAWHDATFRRLAESIYEERAFDRLPLLADALLDAGCADEELLAHCRGGGEHVRGCWAVDVVLRKG